MRQDALFGGSLAIVLHNVGLLLRYVSVMPLLLLPVSFYYREWHAVPGVLAMSAACFLVGSALAMLPTRRDPRLREGLLIAAVGWLVVPLGSVLLFVMTEGWPLLDAYFEAMSAWTGTGMTVADVLELSHTALAWRSLMQWVGGLGVIVLTLAVLARPGTGAFTLYAGEGREDKLRPSILSTVRTLWKLYAALTLVAIGILLAVGLPFWHALNHAMTGISTAGMSILPGGIGEYETSAQRLAFVPIMILGAMPFVAIYALVRGRWSGFRRDEQVKALAVVLVLAFGFLALVLRPEGIRVPASAILEDALFHAASAVSTTGFQLNLLEHWDDRTKLAIAGVMLIGGAAGSTAGGLKLVRGVLLTRGALWKLKNSGLPHFTVTTFPLGGERLSDEEANEEFAEASFILVLWMLSLFIGVLIFLTVLPGAALGDVLFEITSLQANVGLSVGLVTVTMPAAAKATSIVLMWAGRLEILPALLLVRGFIPRLRSR